MLIEAWEEVKSSTWLHEIVSMKMLQKWIRLQYPYFICDNCFPKPVANLGNKTGSRDWGSFQDWTSCLSFWMLQFCRTSGGFFIQIPVWLLITTGAIHGVAKGVLWLEKKVGYAKNGFGFVKVLKSVCFIAVEDIQAALKVSFGSKWSMRSEKESKVPGFESLV